MWKLGRSRLRRALGCVVIAGALVATSGTVTRVAAAEDPSATMHDLSEASDFRVRVSAALVLGHTRPEGALDALEDALNDVHPAVRVAAARALGMLGDPAALPALEKRLGHDASASVGSQLRAAVAQLRRNGGTESDVDGAPRRLPPGVHYLVELGSMSNHSAVGGDRGDELARVLGEAARARAGSMKGTAFLDGDPSLREQAAKRHVPVITLDGNVTQVTEARVGGGMQVQVRVEFAVRRGQTLKGTVSGAATTFGSGGDITEQSRRRLEDDAVQAAVQSALRGAEDGLLVATR
jgi:hypothetical protein